MPFCSTALLVITELGFILFSGQFSTISGPYQIVDDLCKLIRNSVVTKRSLWPFWFSPKPGQKQDGKKSIPFHEIQRNHALPKNLNAKEKFPVSGQQCLHFKTGQESSLIFQVVLQVHQHAKRHFATNLYSIIKVVQYCCKIKGPLVKTSEHLQYRSQENIFIYRWFLYPGSLSFPNSQTFNFQLRFVELHCRATLIIRASVRKTRFLRSHHRK